MIYITTLMIFISSSFEPLLSMWASGVGILIHEVRDGAMAKNLSSSWVEIPILPVPICVILT